MSAIVVSGGHVLGSGGRVFATGSGGGGSGATVSVNSSGLVVNQSATAFMLRGGNFPGLDGQAIQGNFSTGTWANYLSANVAQLKAKNYNFVRLPLNPQCFAGVTCAELTGTSITAAAWGATFLADPNSDYKANVLQFILNSRAAGCYVVADAHLTSPQFTIGGVTHWLGACAEAPFADDDSCTPFWTSSNPAVGFVAWLATNLGTASFNSANGFNSGAAGAFHDSSFGGASGFGDIIFELFNEPYLSNQVFALTTLTGGVPPATSQPSGALNPNATSGSEFVMKNGGRIQQWYLNGLPTGWGGNGGIPAGFTNGSGLTSWLDLGAVGANITSAQGTAYIKLVGYQTLLTGIRSLGASNIVCCNGNAFASGLSVAVSFLPTDAISPPQLAVGWHPYPFNANSQSTSTSFPNTQDPGTANFATRVSFCTAIINNTAGIGFSLPVISTELATNSGTSNTQPDPYMTNFHTYLDSQPTGSCGITIWQENFPSPVGSSTSDRGGTFLGDENIYAATISFTASIASSGSPNISVMTVTGTPSGSVLAGMVIKSVVSGLDFQSMIVSQLTGSAGLAGTYQVMNSKNSSMTYGSQTFTAAAITTWNGMSLTDFNWNVGHA